MKVQVKIRLDEELIGPLDEHADRLDRSRNWLIEHYVIEGLNRDPLVPEPVPIDETELEVEIVRSPSDLPNVGDRGVRITHIPTGIVATSRDPVSQLQNKAKALGLLREALANRPMLPETEPETLHGAEEVAALAREAAAHAPDPEKKHLHRYTKPVQDSDRWDKGQLYRTYECSCGLTSDRAVHR